MNTTFSTILASKSVLKKEIMATNWRVYDNDTVATKLDGSDLPGFFRKKVIVGPGEAALILRDGELEEFLTESSAAVSDILDRMASIFGFGKDISVYFADLTPINLTIYLGESTLSESTKDEDQVDAEVNRQYTVTETERSTKRLLPNWFRRKNYGWNIEADSAGKIKAATATSVEKTTDVSQLCIKALTADKEIIQAACHVKLRVDPQHARKFVGMLKGKKALATWDLAALLRDELFAKILIPEIAGHKAEDFRGNRKLLQHLESLVSKELQRSLADCGLLLDSFTVSWGLTESEQEEIRRRRAEQEEEGLKFANQRLLNHLAREQAVDKNRLANLQELQKAEASGDEDLKKMLLASEIERDLLITEKGIDEAQIAARIRDITLEVEKKESIAKLEKRRAEEEFRLEIEDREFKQKHENRRLEKKADNADMWEMLEMQTRMADSKHDREMSKRRQEISAEFDKTRADIEDRFNQRKLKLDESMARMGMMERLVSKGLDAGTSDADVLKTMLVQSTEQEYATTNEEMVKARSEAQAAANNLDTHRQAQADERGHQANMTHLSAQMMNAAKQNPNTPAVPQQIPPQQIPGQPIIMNVTGAGAQSPTPAAPQSATSSCGSCGTPTQQGWKACPNCGQLLAQTAKKFCTGCGGEMQLNWKACPNCGNTA